MQPGNLKIREDPLFLARFSVLLLASGFSRWGKDGKHSLPARFSVLLETALATFAYFTADS